MLYKCGLSNDILCTSLGGFWIIIFSLNFMILCNWVYNWRELGAIFKGNLILFHLKVMAVDYGVS